MSEQPQESAEDFGGRICAGLIAAPNAGWSQKKLSAWISEQYKAALAAERKVSDGLGKLNDDLQKQLAAEREKVENLHKILGQKRTRIKELQLALDDALAKVKE